MRIIFKCSVFSLIIIVSMLLTGYGQSLSKFGIDTTDNHIPKGLKIGDKAPSFTGYDQTGKQIELKKMLEKGPVVLFFYRGKWCQVCSRYLNSYQDSLNLITDQGFSLVAITPESIENVEQTVKFHNLTFTVIYDCQEQIMKDYNVMFNVTKNYQDSILTTCSTDIALNNGREEARLPVPATYIINKDGIIVALQFDPNYQNRATVNWIIKNLGKAL
jgi:peroxiredoxin